jgi:hypothetical protein
MRNDENPGRFFGTDGDHHLPEEGHRVIASLLRAHLDETSTGP